MAAVAPIYDALLDEGARDAGEATRNACRLGEIIARLPAPAPEISGSESKALGIFALLCRELSATLPAETCETLRRVWLALHGEQMESVTYSQPVDGWMAERASLTRNTLAKGGLAMLVFALLCGRPLHPREERALFALGGLLQVLDDLIDLEGDRAAGAVTLTTLGWITLSDILGMREVVRREFAELIEADLARRSQLRRFGRLAEVHLWVAVKGMTEAGRSQRESGNWRGFGFLIRCLLPEFADMA